MQDLLFHASKKKLYKTLKTNNGYICFSKNTFLSYFGDYIYIFSMDQLKKDFKIQKGPMSGIIVEYSKMRLEGAQLKEEYRIFEDIDLKKYCLGRCKHFNESKDFVSICKDIIIGIETEVKND